jgi:Putative bacterial sensory transduction regulator
MQMMTVREILLMTAGDAAELMDDMAEPTMPVDFMESIDIVEEIEAVIASLDYDKTAMVSHGDQGRVWKFNYGSVEVMVQITGSGEDDSFTAWAGAFDFGTASLDAPSSQHAKLMHKVLEMNWLGTLDAKFAISGEQLVVAVTRPIADISAGEISRGITLVATIADDHDDAFKAEYGG